MKAGAAWRRHHFLTLSSDRRPKGHQSYLQAASNTKFLCSLISNTCCRTAVAYLCSTGELTDKNSTQEYKNIKYMTFPSVSGRPRDTNSEGQEGLGKKKRWKIRFILFFIINIEVICSWWLWPGVCPASLLGSYFPSYVFAALSFRSLLFV